MKINKKETEKKKYFFNIELEGSQIELILNLCETIGDIKYKNLIDKEHRNAFRELHNCIYTQLGEEAIYPETETDK